MQRALMWFRRDLRRTDQPALERAIEASDELAAVFVVDDRLWSGAGENRRAFLSGCVRALGESLGGALVVRRGAPEEVIPALAAEIGADAVYCTTETTPYGRARDRRVETTLAAAGRRLVSVDSSSLVAPGIVRTKSGTSYRVFTPYFRAWSEVPVDRPGGPLAPPLLHLPGEPNRLPEETTPSASLPEPGEQGAAAQLEAFLVGGLDDYESARDRPACDATSRCSPYLHFGCIHPRQILDRLDLRHSAHRAFARQLAWRDFYAEVLFERPSSAWEAWRPGSDLPYDDDEAADERFAAWQAGQTGYPFVDAGMRHLLAQGWMPNRLRMVTASFLVKDLHIDWRRGARHFLDHLVDGDIASNNHGWQWVAGTGTDAAPYHRIFNPVQQGRRFDPDADYIRRFVPELAALDSADAHEPWRSEHGAPAGYPAPIVDHGAERAEALRRYSDRSRSRR